MRIPIYILTGFLGSGKTTLLNRCLADVRFADSAILVNEFGEIALDHLLVKSVDEEVLVLSTGCVCCSVRDDFTAALLDLAERRKCSSQYQFQRVVLETTGIADPNAIHQVILSTPEVRRHYRHASTITVVDGVFGQKNLNQHAEAALQVVVANGLLMSKTDLATQQQVLALENQVEALNSVALRWGRGELASILDELDSTSAPKSSIITIAPKSMHQDAHTHRFSTFPVRYSKPIDQADLEAWLEVLLFSRGNDIFRIKGWVYVKDQPQPFVVNSVYQALYAQQYLDAWPNETRSTELTFICQNLSSTAAMQSLLQVCDSDDSYTNAATRRIAYAAATCEGTEIKDAATRRTAHTAHTAGTKAAPILSGVMPDISKRLLAHFESIESLTDMRPWHRWALHNPWSLASTVVDSWDILSMAQTPAILDVVSGLIGNNIVLFDACILPICSQFVPGWENDAWQFPVNPVAGAVVRLPMTPPARMSFRGPATSADIEIAANQFVVHDIQLDYRYTKIPEGAIHYEWVFRYFPATSQYLRDPTHHLHQRLTDQQPLLNHARIPLWLVLGEDQADNDFVTGFQATGAFWSTA